MRCPVYPILKVLHWGVMSLKLNFRLRIYYIFARLFVILANLKQTYEQCHLFFSLAHDSWREIKKLFCTDKWIRQKNKNKNKNLKMLTNRKAQNKNWQIELISWLKRCHATHRKKDRTATKVGKCPQFWNALHSKFLLFTKMCHLLCI